MTTQMHADSAVNPSSIQVDLACGHRRSIRSPYTHMVNPQVMDAYVEFLGTTLCAECCDWQTADARDPAPARATQGLAHQITAAMRAAGGWARHGAARLLRVPAT